MTIRFELIIYVLFLLSGVLFIVSGILNGSPWSLSASVVFTAGVVAVVAHLERQREKKGGGNKP